MHTFGVILVLLLKQHAIFSIGINLLVVHSETRHNFLDWYKSFGLCMLRWDEINNQLHNIVIALI
jgi:hypothetical protein